VSDRVGEATPPGDDAELEPNDTTPTQRTHTRTHTRTDTRRTHSLTVSSDILNEVWQKLLKVAPWGRRAGNSSLCRTLSNALLGGLAGYYLQTLYISFQQAEVIERKWRRIYRQKLGRKLGIAASTPRVYYYETVGILNVATAPGQLQNPILKRRSIQATVNLGLVRRGEDSARRNDERGGGTNGVSELW
jgi:hypothetical protein